MKWDVARRVALVALAAILAGLLYLCVEGKTLMKLNAEVRHGRRNETLYLERWGSGSYFIGGEGTVYSEDLKTLVEGEGNKNDVRELVFGDGITELGYNTLIDFEGLEALWLGRNLEVADNGSLKGCVALQYVFLPQGFTECGRDFLYNCGKCLVVTDGSAEALPRLKNVSSDRVLANIASYDALLAALPPEREPIDTLSRWWP